MADKSDEEIQIVEGSNLSFGQMGCFDYIHIIKIVTLYKRQI